MVNGFTKFKERFQGFENQYVIIGGKACDLLMEAAGFLLLENPVASFWCYTSVRRCQWQVL